MGQRLSASPGQCPQCTAAAPPRVNIWTSEHLHSKHSPPNKTPICWSGGGQARWSAVMQSQAVRQSASTKTRAHTDTQNSAPSGHASQHRDVLRWLGFQYLFMDTIRGGTLKQNIWCLTENRDHITQDTGKLRADLVCSECVCCARVCNTLQHFIRPRPAAGQSAQSAQSGQCSVVASHGSRLLQEVTPSPHSWLLPGHSAVILRLDLQLAIRSREPSLYQWLMVVCYTWSFKWWMSR